MESSCFIQNLEQFKKKITGVLDEQVVTDLLEALKAVLSKLDSSISYENDEAFHSLIHDFSEDLVNNKNESLQKAYMEDLISEVKLYVKRKRSELEIAKMSRANLHKFNQKCAKLKKEIRLLEKKLKKMNQRELDIYENESDSAFVQRVSSIERHLKNTISKLYEIQKLPIDVGVKPIKKFQFRASEHEQLNIAISDAINKSLFEHYYNNRRTLRTWVLPEFSQFQSIVKDVVEQHSLPVSDVDQYCKKILIQLRAQCKKAYEKNVEDMLITHEIAMKKNEIIEDEDLEKKLQQNDKLATNIDDYVKEYSEMMKKQQDEEDQAESLLDESEDSESDSTDESNASEQTLGSDEELLQFEDEEETSDEEKSKKNLFDKKNMASKEESDTEPAAKKVHLDEIEIID